MSASTSFSWFGSRESVSTNCSARTATIAAFSPYANDPGTTEVGRTYAYAPAPRWETALAMNGELPLKPRTLAKPYIRVL
jgi:hypothetical protein